MGSIISLTEVPGGDNNDDRQRSVNLRVLTNPIVLAKIAGHLGVPDLLSLRLTCQTWNHIFISQIRNSQDLIELNLSAPESRIRALQEFLEVMSSSDPIPFRKYMMINSRASLEGFEAIYGKMMHPLNIIGLIQRSFGKDKSTANKDPHPPGFARFNYRTLPNLKFFSYVLADYHSLPQRSELVSRVIQSQFKMELEDLKLQNWTWDRNDHDHDHQKYHTFLNAVLQPVHDVNTNIWKLKHLQIGTVNRAILQSLLKLTDQESRGENCLYLESFSITITGSGWVDEDDTLLQRQEMNMVLMKFLVKQKATLKELTIIFMTRRRVFSPRKPILLPILDQLHALAIKYQYPGGGTRSTELGHQSIDFDLHYDGETFASTFPALKKFEYPLSCFTYDINRTHPGVTDLSVDAKLEHLELLPDHFPSVTRLELRLDLNWLVEKSVQDRIALSEVWRVWTIWPRQLTHFRLHVQLNTLTAFGAVRPDELLTGVMRDKMPDLRLELDAMNSRDSRPSFMWSDSPTYRLTPGSLGTVTQKYKTRPGISNLCRLEEFELKWLTWDAILDLGVWYTPFWRNELDSSRQFTDICSYCGFGQIGPQLKCITLGIPPNFMSDSCIESMKKSSVLSKVQFQVKHIFGRRFA